MTKKLNPKPFKGNEFGVPKIKKNQGTNKQSIKKRSEKNSGIPKFVANRMARRIAFTTGLPTLTGMSVFIGSYIVVSKGIAEIPPALTLISSAICFFLGLLGLSYGILSASWEETSGSLLGFENISPNIVRMKKAFTTIDSKK